LVISATAVELTGTVRVKMAPYTPDATSEASGSRPSGSSLQAAKVNSSALSLASPGRMKPPQKPVERTRPPRSRISRTAFRSRGSRVSGSAKMTTVSGPAIAASSDSYKKR